LLIRKGGANPNVKMQTQAYALSPLILACMCWKEDRCLEFLRVLLDNDEQVQFKADVNLRGGDGMTALHHFVESRREGPNDAKSLGLLLE